MHFEQRFASEALLEAFLGELSDAGITAELLRKEDYRTSSVRYDDLTIPQFAKLKSSLTNIWKRGES